MKTLERGRTMALIGPRVRAQDRSVVALPAAHVERPHAVGAHVAEGHRRSGLRSWSRAHAGEDISGCAKVVRGENRVPEFVGWDSHRVQKWQGAFGVRRADVRKEVRVARPVSRRVASWTPLGGSGRAGSPASPAPLAPPPPASLDAAKFALRSRAGGSSWVRRVGRLRSARRSPVYQRAPHTGRRLSVDTEKCYSPCRFGVLSGIQTRRPSCARCSQAR
jgi:hypothetical protein